MSPESFNPVVKNHPLPFTCFPGVSGRGFHHGLLFLLCLILLASSCDSNSSTRSQPKAEQGILDLRSWDFERDGPVDLAGEWTFYWNSLLAPGAEPAGNTYLSIPGTWNEMALENGEKTGAYGFATLKLRVLLPVTEPGDVLKITLHSADIAHSLQIVDSKGNSLGRTLKSGVVAESRGSYVPLRARDSASLEYSTEYIIYWQISNFDSTKGGSRHAPRLGLDSAIVNELSSTRSLEFFSLGILLIMGLYHLILFLLNNREKTPLWFGGLCFSMFLYGVITQNYLDSSFPDLYLFEWYKKLGWFSDCLAMIFSILFLKSVFPRQVNRRLMQFALLINLAFILFILVTPFRVYVQGSAALYGLIAFMMLWVFWILGRAVYQKSSILAGVLLMGFAIVILAVINDVLLVEGLIFTEHMTQHGLSALILCQSIVIAIQNHRLHREKILAQKQALVNLEKADRLKDDFLASTSHELKTPLTGIIGIAESLLEGATGKLSAETGKNLSIIVDSGQRLSSLVDDILDFARLKNQDLKLQLGAVNVKHMADRLLKLMQPLVGEKQVELINSVPDDLPPVKADGNRLRQILINLLANAVKFTREGKIEVTAESFGDKVSIAVSDTGIGIRNDLRERIFETFTQGVSSDSRDYGGTGLGLAITRQLVRMHGSEIEVDSKSGGGSRFFFDLEKADAVVDFQNDPTIPSELSRRFAPVVKEESDSITREEAPDSDIQGKTVLIVDDEPVILQILKNHLQFNHFRVLIASDGYQALEMIKKEKPDLVILDLMMPHMNGYQVLEKIREDHPLSLLPVLVLTAKNQLKDLVGSFNAGANDYLTKPFIKEELLNRVSSHLKLKSFSARLADSNRNLEKLNNTLESQVASRTEELDARNTQLKQLVQVLCHDLMNPLANIESIVELLQTDPADFPSMLPLLEISIQNGMEIVNLVRQMQALEDRHFVLELQPYYLKELAEESAKILAKPLKDKQIHLDLSIDGDTVVRVEKTSFINSVLNNLLTNAIKFSFAGSSIRLKSSKREGMVELKITDKGIGMPEHLVKNAFDLDKPTSRLGTRGEHGTGYGLPLVKKFISAYQGRIQLESTEKRAEVEKHGTEITLHLQSGERLISKPADDIS